MKTLFLWLEGPLQAWGYESKFDRRATFSFPTMSGIAGLLLASSGDSGAQTDLLCAMANADFTAVEFAFADAESVTQLRDYHMVGSGYDEKSAWEKLHTLRTREGKTAVGGGAKQTYRYYLQDKKFAVILEFSDELLADKFAASLQAPIFDLYLGRKCCVPTDFIYQGIFASRSEAVTALKTFVEKKTKDKPKSDKSEPDKPLQPVQVCRPPRCEEERLGAFFLSDIPVEFGETKRYAERLVFIERNPTWETL